ncbi:MAG TPA: chemotaxis protein CheW, partial [Syntrophomonadaceae bacterium]|nr:chemotaxis protein CheW [Syntrophomonadaceae bacterium]
MSRKNVFSSAEMQMVTFNLGDESFGVDIMNVQEIIRMPSITRVPQAPVYVDGVTNLRGHILPVIDTRTKFSMEKAEMDGSSRVIVVDINGKTAGLNVDSVSEVLRVEGQSVEAAPASLASGVDSGSITGVVKINDGKKLVMILDVAYLCNIEDQAVEEGQGALNTRSRTVDKDNGTVDEMQIVSFLVGEEEFGLEIEKVKEIIRFPEIVKVPNVPDYIKGIISLRDTLMPIVDLRTKLEAGSDEITDSTRVVVVDLNGTLVGLTVDRVYEVIRLPRETIFPPPQVIMSDTGEKITGIARLDGGKRIIMLMDLQDIITTQVMEELGKHETVTREEQEESSYLLGEMDEEQMVVLRLGSEQYGVSINQVQEITKLTKITKVPRAPRYVEGVINLRGDVIPVLDLRKRFELESNEYNQSTRIIVSDIDKKKVGIIVDEVLEVLRVSQRYIEGAPEICQDN